MENQTIYLEVIIVKKTLLLLSIISLQAFGSAPVETVSDESVSIVETVETQVESTEPTEQKLLKPKKLSAMNYIKAGALFSFSGLSFTAATVFRIKGCITALHYECKGFDNKWKGLWNADPYQLNRGKAYKEIGQFQSKLFLIPAGLFLIFATGSAQLGLKELGYHQQTQ